MDGFKYSRRRVPYIRRVPDAVVGRRESTEPGRSQPSVDIVNQSERTGSPNTLVERHVTVAKEDSLLQDTKRAAGHGEERDEGHGDMASVEQARTRTGVPNGHIDREALRLKRMRLQRKLRRKSVKKHSIKTTISYIAAFVMMFGGGYVAVRGAILNQQLEEQLRVLSASTQNTDNGTSEEDTAVSETASDIPSEKKPKANYLDTYKVASELPRIISIPAISVRARVLQVGVDANNELLTPKSIYDTAWYNASVKPGELGTALIDGHYVGPTTKGVFSHINTLKNGDKVVVERGDGRILSFKVVGIETVPVGQVDMMRILAPNDHSQAKLNLITCGGTYDANTFHFSDRTVVYTVLDS